MHKYRRPVGDRAPREATKPESSGFDWRWFLAIYAILQILRAVLKDR